MKRNSSRRLERTEIDHYLSLLYEELHSFVSRKMGRAPAPLSCTEILNEACLRLIEQGQAMNDTGHFKAIAAITTHQVLVDEARKRHAKKRGGDRGKVTLHDEHALSHDAPLDLLDLDSALSRFKEIRPRQSEVVVLRFFGGLSYSEIGEAMGISPETAKEYWKFAKCWLRRELKRGVETKNE